MTVASIPSRALLGIDAVEVMVEAHLSAGLPGFTLVGLPETAVKESRERVRSAIINSALEFPDQRVTVNLAPADLPKAGGRYDLAIAVATLVASEQIEGFAEAIRGIEMLGELALDGGLRPVPGVVQALLAARKDGRAIIVPAANREALEIVDYSLALGLDSLTELTVLSINLKADGATILAVFNAARAARQKPQQRDPLKKRIDDACVQFNPIRGQARALRALEIAAAGGHNLLMLGPPGSGKTLLATTLSKLLPPMTRDEVLEVASIRSAARGQLALGSAALRPLRAPHHSATMPSLVGGGADAVPGDITLAHRGVLFLDELTEFPRSILDQLRQPLEEGVLWMSRARLRCAFPCRVTLVAATNPCPCGWHGDPSNRCRCSELQRQRYWNRLSGPFLDRLDLQCRLEPVPAGQLRRCFKTTDDPTENQSEESFSPEAIQAARIKMCQRNPGGQLNSQLSALELGRYGQIEERAFQCWEQVVSKRQLSMRSSLRLLRVARTIADLDAVPTVGEQHLAEAICFRSYDHAPRANS